MLNPSSICAKAQAYIKRKLLKLSNDHSVDILIAVESGSRAWGYPSYDSDYDVRFIYKHKQEAYLSVMPLKDVLETELTYDEILSVPLDMGGWDLRKTLYLSLHSNAVVHEWLSSPIIYLQDEKTVSALRDQITSFADINRYFYHYHRLCCNAYNQIKENDTQTKLKLYCYALRPALCLNYMRKHNLLPPMECIIYAHLFH